MGLRVWEGGESECPVLGRPGQVPSCNGEDRGCTFGQHYPTRKRADFHLVARHEKAWQTASRGKADACPELVEGTAGIVLAGAPSSVTIVHAVAPSVYREVVTGRHDLSQRVLPWGV